MLSRVALFALVLVCSAVSARFATAQSLLESRLLDEGIADLVTAAKKDGDAKRGAVVFYQPHTACRKCHAISGPALLGPNLAEKREGVTDAFLVESVLDPSKSIRKGFETVVVVTDEGKQFVGLLVEETPDKVVLREGRPDGKPMTFDRASIDQIAKSAASIMPKGQVSQLASRRQFLDLIRYLMEIRDGGPMKARELEPAPQLYQIKIAKYEKDIDHAGMIASLDGESFKRGEAIYNRLCINCHGTHDRPGSLPTSLKFASGRFRNGSDPHTMYQTLTRGFGMMVAQTWMVPQQKYDVVHYIREAYLKSHNKSQLFNINDQYLAGLPKGTTRGPKPTNIQPWANMDYGQSLVNTYEFGTDGSNFAYKGIAMRLDAGPGGVSRGNAWMVFDHDTMRVAGAWTGKGFIDWHGIHFDGRHGIHPRATGHVHFENPTGPGWGYPQNGTFNDPRLRGRDDKPYGPLPHEWAHYKGLYHGGNGKTVIEYTIGTTDVLESPGLIYSGEHPTFLRTMNLGERPTDLVLQVARQDFKDPRVVPIKSEGREFVALVDGNTAGPPKDAETFAFNGATFAEVRKADAFDMKASDFTITARIRTKSGGTILCKTETGPRWIPGGRTLFIRGGRLTFDIGWVGAVTAKKPVNDGKYHYVAATFDAKTETIRLFVDGKEDSKGTLKDQHKVQNHALRLGFTNSNFPRSGSFFEGTLKNVRFFRRRLSDGELAKPADLPQDKSLVGHWPLHEAVDGKVADTSEAKHDARVIQGEAGTAIGSSEGPFVAGLEPAVEGAKWTNRDDGSLLLTIPAGKQPLKFSLWTAALTERSEVAAFAKSLQFVDAAVDLTEYTQGGPTRWPQKLTTEVVRGNDDGPFAADVLAHPANNPWLAQVRLTGFDFFPDGDRMAASAWDGDVWMVSGLAALDAAPSGKANPVKLTWQRIATGLFQPLGVKVIDGKDIYVTCRDQIVILRDLNGDSETDFYENFNNDHQVTEHFHEFAMGLQTDAAGNFYYAKSARHALKAVVPHHGTLLKVSKDGSKTEILANGFRAANGVCLNPDGTFIVTDQEGHWNPKNRINWVKKGGFYGNMFGYHDVTDSSDEAMLQPLCWITNSFDRSPAELLWCDSDKWGPLKGSLLNLSYGYGQIYVVPHEDINGQKQGGMSPLPLPQFPTGVMRGRFHPVDGQLYTCGMFAWAGSRQQPGGLYRVRYTGKPVHVPVGLQAEKNGMRLTFTEKLDPNSSRDPNNYRVKVWSLKRTANYGSKHYDERELKVTDVVASDNGKSVLLVLPDIAPTWCMEIRYSLKGENGKPFDGVIHNTIHALGN